MKRFAQRFFLSEHGQDLVEYTLLIAFVIATIIGLASGFGKSIAGVASVSNSQLAAGNVMAASGS